MASPRPAPEWTEDDVAKWLIDNGFDEHVEGFRENDINGELLLDMTSEFLKELGMPSLGKRMKLLKLIEKIRPSDYTKKSFDLETPSPLRFDPSNTVTKLKSEPTNSSPLSSPPTSPPATSPLTSSSSPPSFSPPSTSPPSSSPLSLPQSALQAIPTSNQTHPPASNNMSSSPKVINLPLSPKNSSLSSNFVSSSPPKAASSSSSKPFDPFRSSNPIANTSAQSNQKPSRPTKSLFFVKQQQQQQRRQQQQDQSEEHPEEQQQDQTPEEQQQVEEKQNPSVKVEEARQQIHQETNSNEKNNLGPKSQPPNQEEKPKQNERKSGEKQASSINTELTPSTTPAVVVEDIEKQSTLKRNALLQKLPPPPVLPVSFPLKEAASERFSAIFIDESEENDSDYSDSEQTEALKDRDRELEETKMQVSPPMSQPLTQPRGDKMEVVNPHFTKIMRDLEPVPVSSTKSLTSGDNQPVMAVATRAERMVMEGKLFEIRKGEMFLVITKGEQNWKVKPVERRGNDIFLPADLLQIESNVFEKLQKQYGNKIYAPEVLEEHRPKKSLLNVSAREFKNPMMAGYLMKIGASVIAKKVWKRRWCILQDYVVYYYETPEDDVALGKVPLPGYTVSVEDDFGVNAKKFTFKVTHPNSRTYVFAAPTKEEMDRWMKAMTLSTVLQDQ